MSTPTGTERRIDRMDMAITLLRLHTERAVAHERREGEARIEREVRVAVANARYDGALEAGRAALGLKDPVSLDRLVHMSAYVTGAAGREPEEVLADALATYTDRP